MTDEYTSPAKRARDRAFEDAGTETNGWRPRPALYRTKRGTLAVISGPLTDQTLVGQAIEYVRRVNIKEQRAL